MAFSPVFGDAPMGSMLPARLNWAVGSATPSSHCPWTSCDESRLTVDCLYPSMSSAAAAIHLYGLSGVGLNVTSLGSSRSTTFTVIAPIRACAIWVVFGEERLALLEMSGIALTLGGPWVSQKC